MCLLEPMSAEPIASLYESAGQQLPASYAFPQYTPRLNFEDTHSQIAMAMLMMLENNGQTETSDRIFSYSKSYTLINCQAEQPNYTISATDCLYIYIRNTAFAQRFVLDH